jgi:hypothetical protein
VRDSGDAGGTDDSPDLVLDARKRLRRIVGGAQRREDRRDSVRLVGTVRRGILLLLRTTDDVPNQFLHMVAASRRIVGATREETAAGHLKEAMNYGMLHRRLWT